MRKKRQVFQKEIRREALNNIFRRKRQQIFDYRFKDFEYNAQQLNLQQQIQQACSQFQRFAGEIFQSQSHQNLQNLFTIANDSNRQVKQILSKGKQSVKCLKIIIDSWTQFGMDTTIMQAARKLKQIKQNSNAKTIKEILRMFISQFHIVFHQYYLIQYLPQKRNQFYKFLYLCLEQLQNVPKSTDQILKIIQIVLKQSVQIRHQFFFWNKQHNKQYQKYKKITFQDLITVIFHNRQNFKSYRDRTEQRQYNEIALKFLDIFRQFCSELTDMDKFLEYNKKKANQKQLDQHKRNQNGDQEKNEKIYFQTLGIYNYPKQIVLKSFLDKSFLIIIFQMIKSQKQYCLNNWTQQIYYQQALTQCIETFKLYIEFHPEQKFIQNIYDEISMIVDLLTLQGLNDLTKCWILYLIDNVICIDDNNGSRICHQLIKYNNLVPMIWAQEGEQLQKVKLNIINNLLLIPIGHSQICRFFSNITVFLYQKTQFCQLTLTFIINYFMERGFKYSGRGNDQLAVGLLYQIPTEAFKTVKEIQQDIFILNKLYEQGFQGALPNRYHEWSNENNRLNLNAKQDSYFQIQRGELVQRMHIIFNQISKQWKTNNVDRMDE